MREYFARPGVSERRRECERERRAVKLAAHRAGHPAAINQKTEQNGGARTEKEIVIRIILQMANEKREL